MKADAIREIYAQVQAPSWAAANLDALADVLRDLSWLPEGPVVVRLPDVASLPVADREALLHTLARAVDETIDSLRPVRVT
jgi:hypothetical protein